MSSRKTTVIGAVSRSENTTMGSPHRFVLVIEGGAVEKSALLVQAGCADASIGSIDGTEFAEFERHDSTLEDALASAIWAVESVAGLHVRRVEPDDLVTAAEIAERLGRSRESVRLLSKGARGIGDFPSPISHLRSRQRLWRWSEIAAWARTVDDDQRREARLVATVNAALEYRRLAPTVGGFVPSLLGLDPSQPREQWSPEEREERVVEAAEAVAPPTTLVVSDPLPAAAGRSTGTAFEGQRPATTSPADSTGAVAAPVTTRPSTSYWKRTRVERATAPLSDEAGPPTGGSDPPTDETASPTDAVTSSSPGKGDDRRIGRRHKIR
ncbi:MAG TPA: hypothetical protein VED63_06145 [Acidimicrobiales bacterium]|nr:hypothetical protein [Acidimicrobiales bacterium]